MDKEKKPTTVSNRIPEILSQVFEELLKREGDTPEVRLAIVNYTFGYMGASFGLHVS